MKTTRELAIYVIQRVSFGYKPSGKIVSLELKKTPKWEQMQFLYAAEILQNNTYMYYVIKSTSKMKAAKELTNNLENFNQQRLIRGERLDILLM